MTLVFLLPQTIKDNYFILDLTNPSYHTMFLSNYVHSNFDHFFENIAMYYVAIILIFNFATKQTSHMFSGWIFTISIFAILPFLLSIVTLEYINIPISSQGFSGIVAAFIGYIIYTMYNFLKTNYDENINPNFICLILMINVLLTLPNLDSAPEVYLIICLIIAVLLYMQKNSIVKFITSAKKENKQKSRKQLSLPAQFYLIISYSFLILSLFLLPSLIPKNVFNDHMITNTMAHYTGYVFGIFIPLIIEHSTNLKQN